jgi:2-isopropylmalate synthase
VDLGVSFVEGGWPGSNPKDAVFFKRWHNELAPAAAAANTRLCAFGSTRRRNVDAASDPQLQALLECGAPTVTLVAKAWDAQVDQVLRCSLVENLAMIADSVRLLKRAGREVVIDAEHFLDGYAASKQYALDCLRAAAGEGADWLVLCDTNGGSMPWTVQEACEVVCRDLGLATGPQGHGHTGPRLGIHAHNDAGCAIANSLAAVRGGATMVQGCINGYGEVRRASPTFLSRLVAAC